MLVHLRTLYLERRASHLQQQIDERTRDLLARSEEHTSELQSLMRISYAVFCLKKKIINETVQQFDKERNKGQQIDNNYTDYNKTCYNINHVKHESILLK